MKLFLFGLNISVISVCCTLTVCQLLEYQFKGNRESIIMWTVASLMATHGIVKSLRIK